MGNHVENGDGKFWLTYGDVGIKVFPRVASTTLREAYGQPNSRMYFNHCPIKMCIVRNPWDRLFSVYAGMINAYTSGLPGYPASTTEIDGLVKWILATPQAKRDWHVRSMADQMMGWQPADDEVYLLADVLHDPPHGLPKIEKHHHRTPSDQKIEYQAKFDAMDERLRAMFYKEYERDFQLYETALNRHTRA